MALESAMVSYCGQYCDDCEVYQGRIREVALQLGKMLAIRCVQQVMVLEGFPDAQKMLEFLVDRFGQCVGCKKGGGNPYCEIRKCCSSKGLNLCIECDVVTCEKLSL